MQELVVGGRLQPALSNQLDRQHHVRERVRESNRTSIIPHLYVSFFRPENASSRSLALVADT